ncbi:hypothetical protein KIW84_064804 [Lathyrus oleraceus]|uniref:Arabidopsis retrotransposon Orf1 C-terminal domain-containing protein n=1 Tax=Pisum sativum TaxID=3888 RepID=A0A9D4WB94_PEA|nr:hypothetical protein KIW84_064804 [Pisum sativum]
MVSRPVKDGIWSRLCEGKVLAPLRIRRTRRDPRSERMEERLLKTAQTLHTRWKQTQMKDGRNGTRSANARQTKPTQETDCQSLDLRQTPHKQENMETECQSLDLHQTPNQQTHTQETDCQSLGLRQTPTSKQDTGNQLPIAGLTSDSKHTQRVEKDKGCPERFAHLLPTYLIWILFPNLCRMQNFDDMHVVFIDDSQRGRYIVLYQRPMAPTRYPDKDCMDALGIEPSIRFLCHQLQWNEFADNVNNTYRNLTLEFLSSFAYDPYSGPDGHAVFRLFGIEYSFIQKEFGDLLGFQTTPNDIPKTPMGYFLSREVEKF